MFFVKSSILLLALVSLNSVLAQNISEVANAFLSHGLVPDVISEPPTGYLNVTFPSGAVVNLGEEIILSDVGEEPTVCWEADESQYYTLVMTDPDVPSRADPYLREVRHWLVVNIPGSRLEEGSTLTSFARSNPPSGSGLHRYAFLIYQQNGTLEFEETFETFDRDRGYFSTENYIAKYDIKTPPLFGNFYQSQPVETITTSSTNKLLINLPLLMLSYIMCLY